MTGAAKSRRPRARTVARETREQDTRDVILRQAVRHFAKFGYEGTRIRQVLLDAGVNLALAHYHFGSKQAMYDAAVRLYLDNVLRERREALAAWKIRKVRKAESSAQKVTSLFTCYVQSHMRVASGPDGQEYAKLIQGVWSNPGPLTDDLLHETLRVRENYLEELQKLVKHGSRDYLFRVMNALVAAMLAESIDHADNVAVNECIGAEKAERRAAFVARLIGGGLIASLKGRPAIGTR